MAGARRLRALRPRREGRFRAWVFRIATNILLECMRPSRSDDPERGARRRVVSLPAELAAHATSVSQAAARAEGVTRLVAAAAELDATDRKVLVHCGLEGLSAPKAAELCGLTPDACAKRWQRLSRPAAGLRGVAGSPRDELSPLDEVAPAAPRLDQPRPSRRLSRRSIRTGDRFDTY